MGGEMDSYSTCALEEDENDIRDEERGLEGASKGVRGFNFTPLCVGNVPGWRGDMI